MRQSIVHVAHVVRDYDEAIAFYTQKLHFILLEDTYQPVQDKRWVVVAPPDSVGTTLLLVKASKPEQEPFVGNQTGGRVFLFLNTDDYWRDYTEMVAQGIKFIRSPKEEAYGLVAVFEDLYGNLWDLLQLNANHPISQRKGYFQVNRAKLRLLIPMNVIRRILVQAQLLAIIIVACVPSFAQSGNQDSNLGSNNMSTFIAPVVVEFPLRGEWMAPNTPGKQIPSHGTDQLAETYAYDFLQVDWSRTGHPFYDTSVLEYLFHGVPLNRCYGWGKEVYAPCDGRIIQARDGYPERQTVNLFSDLHVAVNNARTFDLRTNDLQAVAGNYVIMSCANTGIYAAFAHLQQGSIAVSADSVINKGQIIGKIGHSGNSTAPHLHFQLMDSPDMNTARGVPCAFERYEVLQNNQWQLVTNGIPSDKDRIRFNK